MRVYFKSIIDSMPSILISIDCNGTVHEWNLAAENYTQINATNAIGKTIWELLPPFRKFEQDCADILTKREKKHFSRELISTNNEIYMDVSMFPLIQENVQEVVIRFDDISALEKTQQQLSQAQKMEMIGNLVGGVAHDFNNILTGIVGTLSLLRIEFENNKDLGKAEINELLTIMEGAGSRATDMIKQILTISSRQSKLSSIVDVNKVIHDAINISMNTFDKRVSIGFSPYPEAVTVTGDEVQLEQVILNLMINAMHAMTIMRREGEQWGGNLDVMIDKIVLDNEFYLRYPDLANTEHYWKISVCDKGIGMDEETISKVYDPFFTTKEKGKGSGLGMSMVYNIINQHKGTIEIKSVLGKGTTVEVYLPVLDQAQQEKKNDNVEIARGNGLVLVIDDEPMVRQIANKILTHYGYNVILAEEGEQGLEIYQQRSKEIDLIILDINMPKMSGDEIFPLLQKVNPDVKVIITTGFVKDTKSELLKDKGIVEYIQKPYTMKVLASAVAKALKKEVL